MTKELAKYAPPADYLSDPLFRSQQSYGRREAAQCDVRAQQQRKNDLLVAMAMIAFNLGLASSALVFASDSVPLALLLTASVGGVVVAVTYAILSLLPAKKSRRLRRQ